MTTLKLFLVPALSLLLTTSPVSQTRKKGPVRRANAKAVTSEPAPEPPSQPTTPTMPKAPVALAVVNGQTITTADIEPRVRQEIDTLEERIAQARREILEIQINTALLEFEAQKRKLTSQQLYDLEVSKRVKNPTDAEVSEFIQTNRDQLGGSDAQTLRSDAISLWRANQEAIISEDFVRKLRTTNPVVTGVSISSPSVGPSSVLATVGGKPIVAGVILERLKPTTYKLRLETYLIQREALERTIDDILLIAEANRRNVAPEEIVRTEVSEKVQAPSPAEVEKFYSENKARIGGDLDSMRPQLSNYLQDQERNRLERAMSERLRKGVDVRLLFSEPVRPQQQISVDDDPSRGDATAPVTVVEFTDFQCPACAAMHPILEEVVKTYEKKVRFVVRDFPLTMHPQARKAAEAANAAHAQGKFFEYVSLLFKRQKALDIPSLKKYASELGLDRARFDAALDKGAYAAEVRRDIDDGQIYGIDSTPSIFINGVLLTTLSADGLRSAIDRALATTSTPQPQPE